MSANGEKLQSDTRQLPIVTRRACSSVVMPWFAALMVWALTIVHAGSATAGQSAEDIVVRDAWVRAAREGVRSTGGYLEIENRSNRPVELTSVTVDGVGIVELHVSSMLNDRMSMRHVATLTIPARGTLALAPGGAHLMLLDLAKPLAEGSKASMTLRFGPGLTKTVVATVRPVVATVPQ